MTSYKLQVTENDSKQIVNKGTLHIHFRFRHRPSTRAAREATASVPLPALVIRPHSPFARHRISRVLRLRVHNCLRMAVCVAVCLGWLLMWWFPPRLPIDRMCAKWHAKPRGGGLGADGKGREGGRKAVRAQARKQGKGHETRYKRHET